jgi:hypothetical protein
LFPRFFLTDATLAAFCLPRLGGSGCGAETDIGALSADSAGKHCADNPTARQDAIVRNFMFSPIFVCFFLFQDLDTELCARLANRCSALSAKRSFCSSWTAQRWSLFHSRFPSRPGLGGGLGDD